MRIVCPSCSAAYDVPDSLVTPGRVVRCARCGGEWTPLQADITATIEEAAPAAAADARRPTIEEVVAPLSAPRSAMERLAATAPPPQSRLPLRLAWVASLLVIAAALWGAFVWRDTIVTQWPPSVRAYALFGLHPAQKGNGPHG